MSPERARASVAKTALGYAAMIAGTILAFLWIRRVGAGAVAPEPVLERAAGGFSGERIDSLLHVLLALLVILVAARALGFVFRRLRQPPVIGEVIGILLGPSLLGRVAPEAYAFLLPPSAGLAAAWVLSLSTAAVAFLIAERWSATALAAASLGLPYALLWLVRGIGRRWRRGRRPRLSGSSFCTTSRSSPRKVASAACVSADWPNSRSRLPNRGRLARAAERRPQRMRRPETRVLPGVSTAVAGAGSPQIETWKTGHLQVTVSW